MMVTSRGPRCFRPWHRVRTWLEQVERRSRKPIGGVSSISFKPGPRGRGEVGGCGWNGGGVLWGLREGEGWLLRVSRRVDFSCELWPGMLKNLSCLVFSLFPFFYFCHFALIPFFSLYSLLCFLFFRNYFFPPLPPPFFSFLFLLSFLLFFSLRFVVYSPTAPRSGGRACAGGGWGMRGVEGGANPSLFTDRSDKRPIDAVEATQEAGERTFWNCA